jgi:hypothetical protein
VPSKEQDHLASFLASFDVGRLGEGDPLAGANLLACQAVALADIARPGSALVFTDGTTIPVGCNLLVSGSLSASLVIDHVTIPIGVMPEQRGRPPAQAPGVEGGSHCPQGPAR